MSLLPPLDNWDFLNPRLAESQADLRVLVDELLDDELQTLDTDGTLQILLDAHLRVVVVDVVANTVRQLINHVDCERD